jgi:hypothetical protein
VEVIKYVQLWVGTPSLEVHTITTFENHLRDASKQSAKTMHVTIEFESGEFINTCVTFTDDIRSLKAWAQSDLCPKEFMTQNNKILKPENIDWEKVKPSQTWLFLNENRRQQESNLTLAPLVKI